MRTIKELNNKISQVCTECIKTTSKQLEKDVMERYKQAVENSNHIHEWIRKEE